MSWKFTTLDPKAVASQERENFGDAFRDMYRYVKGLLDAGQLSYQVLETTIWVDTPLGVPLFFTTHGILRVIRG